MTPKIGEKKFFPGRLVISKKLCTLVSSMCPCIFFHLMICDNKQGFVFLIMAQNVSTQTTDIYISVYVTNNSYYYSNNYYYKYITIWYF